MSSVRDLATFFNNSQPTSVSTQFDDPENVEHEPPNVPTQADIRRDKFVEGLRNPDLRLREYDAGDLEPDGAIVLDAIVSSVKVRSENNKLVAVKQFGVRTEQEILWGRDPPRFERVLKRFICEARISSEVDHPKLVKMLGFVERFQTDGGLPGLVFPWYPNKDIRDWLTVRKNNVPVDTRLKLLCDVLEGLCYLHANNIYHRDLKGANILVDANDTANICDFGLAKVIGPDMQATYDSSVAKTPDWEPPEYFSDNKDMAKNWHEPTAGGDMWSFGCTFLEVLRNERPFKPYDPRTYLSRKTGPPKPKDLVIDESHWEFMQQCWDINPTGRPSAADALESLRKSRENLG